MFPVTNQNKKNNNVTIKAFHCTHLKKNKEIINKYLFRFCNMNITSMWDNKLLILLKMFSSNASFLRILIITLFHIFPSFYLPLNWWIFCVWVWAIKTSEEMQLAGECLTLYLAGKCVTLYCPTSGTVFFLSRSMDTYCQNFIDIIKTACFICFLLVYK